MRRCDVDAVVIATHPVAHVPLTLEAIDAGFPVMLEKPAALDMIGAERIRRAVEESGLAFLVNHQHLFAPAFEILRQVFIGHDRLSITAEAGGSGPHRDYSPLWDYGPHDVAMVLSLMQHRPSAIGAGCVPFGAGVMYSLAMTFAHGRATVSVTNGETRRRRRCYVQAGRREGVYDESAKTPRLVINGKDIAVSEEPSLTAAIRAFVRGVDGNRCYRFGPRWAVDVCHVLSEADASIRGITPPLRSSVHES
jgi:predicted dehydrogenase